MRLLVIEDEPQLARHVTRALVRHGHEASAQHDGAAGLQAALERAPDLIVLDLNLPTLDGLTVLAKLREMVDNGDSMVSNAALWEDTIDRIGRWVDFKGAYKTMDKDYMESVWWGFPGLITHILRGRYSPK